MREECRVDQRLAAGGEIEHVRRRRVDRLRDVAEHRAACPERLRQLGEEPGLARILTRGKAQGFQFRRGVFPLVLIDTADILIHADHIARQRGLRSRYGRVETSRQRHYLVAAPLFRQCFVAFLRSRARKVQQRAEGSSKGASDD